MAKRIARSRVLLRTAVEWIDHAVADVTVSYHTKSRRLPPPLGDRRELVSAQYKEDGLVWPMAETSSPHNILDANRISVMNI